MEFDLFIKGETEAFKKAFTNENGYVSCILCEPYWQSGELAARNNEICVLPIVGFPEISMYGAAPWGGFGANPIPRRIRWIWDACKSEMQGGFPYSEGIYEDINKFIISRMYRYGDYDVTAALAEYARAYFSVEDSGIIARCLSEMETTLTRGMADGRRYVIANPELCEKIYDELKKCDDKMTREIRDSWRWRIVFLRAFMCGHLRNLLHELKETGLDGIHFLTAPTLYDENTVFMDDRALFIMTAMGNVAIDFRSMESDFGILPLPKLDSSQPEYHSNGNPWGPIGIAVPAYADNPERTGLIMETMAALSYDTVQPAMYDNILQQKIARDEDSQKMLDLIYQNTYFDLNTIHDFGGSTMLLLNCMAGVRENFVSEYAKIKDNAEKQLQDLIDAYKAN